MKLGNKTPLALIGLAAIAASGIVATVVLKERRKQERESEIDDRIADSFPASDPPWQP